MQWRGRRGSSNIEDRRRSRGGGRGGGRVAAGGIGGIGLIAVVAIGYFVFGVDLTPLLREGGGGGFVSQQGQPAQITQADEEAAQFVSVVLADTEEVWATVFQEQLGETYQPPVLVLFKGATTSPCGGASAQTGPFYCPLDEKVYLDTDFFTTMSRQLGAGGDFAAAYVVAHEVGHHIQNELGVLRQTAQARQTDNSVSVRIELMADCFAGLWAARAQARFGTLEPGDIEEAMNAAEAIGDDALQGGRARPETFTHGTSEQRQRWFAAGYNDPRVTACDTFAARTF